MREQAPVIVRARGVADVLPQNRVLRNTYLLLSMTLLFSAAMATFAMASNALPLSPWMTLIGYFGLLFLTNALRNSVWGIAAVFALTGFMGYTLGPIVNFYAHNIVNGHQVVMMALGGTGAIFLGLSAYALTSKKDFSFMRGFIFAGVLVAFLASIANLFFHVPALSLVISAVFIVLSSGIILMQTSDILSGSETNYIMATITLYVSLYNIFISLLQLLGAFSSRD